MSALVILTLWLGGNGLSGAAPAPPKESPPAVAEKRAAVPPNYRYSAVGKPDPFLPFMETDAAVIKQRQETALKQAGGVTVVKGVPISPLQRLDVENFRVIGIIGDETKRTAMIEDGTAKKFYPIAVGTPIGLNNGRVAKIERDRVIVAEPVQGKGKKQATRLVTMKLYKHDEGRP
jgi:Tfp pilus assembly protein PilP